MSDLTGKTITIPADLTMPGIIPWSPALLRAFMAKLPSGKFYALERLLGALADEIERQHPPRMDEPDIAYWRELIDPRPVG